MKANGQVPSTFIQLPTYHVMKSEKTIKGMKFIIIIYK